MRFGICPIVIRVDEEDLEALARDLAEIFLRYGPTPADCAPHLRQARAAELERARNNFQECIRVTNAGP